VSRADARWQLVNELFHAAVAVSPAERDAFLSIQCGEDGALRAEVESLLAVHRDDDQRTAVPVRSGSRFGDYEITGFIASGAMGDVYRARDTRLGRDAALKVLPAAVVSDPGRRARFEREARTLASLTHPHIATIYGVEERDGISALALELVDGETLADRIARGRLPVDEALRIAKQIAAALETAHEHGIVHRDLKPANVKITRDGVVKVLDFGLAKLTDSRGDATLPAATPVATLPHMTGVGVIVGTPAYMSPEQARGERADQRSDIWAFGCVLYEMLTGQPAFSANTVADTLARVLAGEPNLEALPKGVPESVRALITRCLTKDRVQRIPHASVLRYLLDESNTPKRDESWRAWTLQLLQDRNSRVVVIVALVFLIPVLGELGDVVRAVLPTRTSVSQPAIRDGDGYRAVVEVPSGLEVGAERANDHFLSISPDGHRIAVVARADDGVIRLWLQGLDHAVTQPLPGTEDASDPFWSPDGRYLGFFQAGKLKKMMSTGGGLVTLCDARGGGGATWNRNNVIVFSDFSSLYRVSAGGGTPTLISSPGLNSSETYQFPFFLPDGQHFVHRGAGRQTYVRSLDSNDVKRLGAGGNAQFAQGRLIFWRDGMLLAQTLDTGRLELIDDVIQLAGDVRGTINGSSFSVSSNGVIVYQAQTKVDTQLAWVNRTGGVSRTFGERDYYNELELSPDAAHLAVTIGDSVRGTSDIWIFDVARGVRTRLTFDPLDDARAVWSPDGARVMFASNRAGGTFGYDLYEKASNGSGTEHSVLAADGQQYPASWSSDGKHLLFGVGATLMALPLIQNAKPFSVLTIASAIGGSIRGRLSPDGRWLAYTSSESGRNEVYLTAFPSPGGKWLIGPGAWPRWRRDGKELFFVDPTNRLTAVSVTPNGDALTVGAMTPLFQLLSSARVGYPYDVSPDGQEFVLNTSEQVSGGSLKLLINWPAIARN
jgi:serine/threonine protein kinase/Tol biopolymer transport system component